MLFRFTALTSKKRKNFSTWCWRQNENFWTEANAENYTVIRTPSPRSCFIAVLQLLQLPLTKSTLDRLSLLYRVSQEEYARLREGVPYVKEYRYNPKHLCPKLNDYGDNGQRKLWSPGGSTHSTCQLTVLSMSVLECGVIWRQFSSR